MPNCIMGKTCPIDTSIVHFLLLISKISVHLILRYWFICRFQRGSSWGCPCPQTGPWCTAVALACCLVKPYTNTQLFRYLHVLFIWPIISFMSVCLLLGLNLALIIHSMVVNYQAVVWTKQRLWGCLVCNMKLSITIPLFSFLFGL